MKKHYHYIKDTLLVHFDKRFTIKKSKVKWITFNIGEKRDNNKITITDSHISHFSIKIKGRNNNIFIKDNAKVAFHGITIIGDNNQVIYDGCNAIISVLIRGNACSVSIGKKSLLDESTKIVCMGYKNSIEIGKECMFAEDVELWASDTHPITDLNNNIINPSKPIKIGNHVWLCKGVRVMKGVEIGHNTILGLGSIVTKNIPSNAIAAGNPAKVTKTEVNWKSGFTKE